MATPRADEIANVVWTEDLVRRFHTTDLIAILVEPGQCMPGVNRHREALYAKHPVGRFSSSISASEFDAAKKADETELVERLTLVCAEINARIPARAP